MSSLALDDPSRGFSFRLDGPLDMRMDPEQELTAADIVNGESESELARILYEYGEERASRRIARAIVQRAGAFANLDHWRARARSPSACSAGGGAAASIRLRGLSRPCESP